MKPTRVTAPITSVSSGIGAATSQVTVGRSAHVANAISSRATSATVASDIEARGGETATFSADRMRLIMPQAALAARPTTQLMIRTGTRRQAESED